MYSHVPPPSCVSMNGLVQWSTQKTPGRTVAFDLKYQQGMPWSKHKGVSQAVSEHVPRSETLCFALLFHTSASLILCVAPVCLLQGGRNRKYSAAASCLLHRGLCVTCGCWLPTITSSLILCINSMGGRFPRGLSASSILKTDPHTSPKIAELI